MTNEILEFEKEEDGIHPIEKQLGFDLGAAFMDACFKKIDETICALNEGDLN